MFELYYFHTFLQKGQKYAKISAKFTRKMNLGINNMILKIVCFLCLTIHCLGENFELDLRWLFSCIPGIILINLLL